MKALLYLACCTLAFGGDIIVRDAQELAALSGPLNRSDVPARMRERAARAIAALNGDLYAPGLGSGGTYANKLLNGSWVPRWAPTVFAPLLTGAVPRARAPGGADPARSGRRYTPRSIIAMRCGRAALTSHAPTTRPITKNSLCLSSVASHLSSHWLAARRT